MFTGHTIVAPATPAGVGAIAVIRISGDSAIEIVSKLWKGKPLAQVNSHTAHHGYIVAGSERIDEVVATVFRSPKSYTGEDVVEISGHGSPFLVQKIISLLMENGARLAKPGEFTLRAFLNGKMDLSQAEAVADLIQSSSESERQTAMQQMRGGFLNEIKELRARLIRLASLVELELDFSEEDVEFADRKELHQLLNELETVLSRLVRSFEWGKVIRNGVATVIAGRPNAGKSTLLNALLNEERAIVSEIPGTTRDTIEEVITLGGILFRLIDTAGIRQGEDVLEKIGIERTLEKLSQATLIVYLFDVANLSAAELDADLKALRKQNATILIAGNKCDQLSAEKLKDMFPQPGIIFISAKNHIHLDELRHRLLHSIQQQPIGTGETIVTNSRHRAALNRALEAIGQASHSLQKGASGEFLASDIKQALQALGEITGEVTSDEILGEIFSKFCIGK